jgi:hypothetical protein
LQWWGLNTALHAYQVSVLMTELYPSPTALLRTYMLSSLLVMLWKWPQNTQFGKRHPNSEQSRGGWALASWLFPWGFGSLQFGLSGRLEEAGRPFLMPLQMPSH